MAPARNAELAVMTIPIVIEISRNGNRIAAPSQPPAGQAAFAGQHPQDGRGADRKTVG